MAIIEAIWAFIIGLFSAAIIPFKTIINNEIPVILKTPSYLIKTTGIIIPISPYLGIDSFTLALFLIIGLPVVVFLFGVFSNALFAVFYNFIATKFIKIKLEFQKISGSLHELRSLPVVPAAAPVAVFAVFGVIMGLISLLSLVLTGDQIVGNLAYDLIVIIGNGLIYFVGYFSDICLNYCNLQFFIAKNWWN